LYTLLTSTAENVVNIVPGFFTARTVSYTWRTGTMSMFCFTVDDRKQYMRTRKPRLGTVPRELPTLKLPWETKMRKIRHE